MAGVTQMFDQVGSLCARKCAARPGEQAEGGEPCSDRCLAKLLRAQELTELMLAAELARAVRRAEAVRQLQTRE